MADTDYLENVNNEQKPTPEQRMLYFVVGLAVTAIPIYLYNAIFFLPLNQQYAPVFFVVSLLNAVLMTFAYHNVTYSTKSKLLDERESSLTLAKVRGVTSRDSKSSAKDILATKKREQVEITTKECIAYSILYNNALFLSGVLVFAFYIFRTTPPTYNYVLSVSLAAALATLTSGGSR